MIMKTNKRKIGSQTKLAGKERELVGELHPACILTSSSESYETTNTGGKSGEKKTKPRRVGK